MKVQQTALEGLIIIEPQLFKDDRGYFFVPFQQELYTQLGLPHFVQDNVSHSKRNVLRGLHYQKPNAQGKLVWVAKGAVWDVVVDIRKSSQTFGQYFHIHLNDENHTQLYIPPGFAHGFCVLSEEALFNYKCTDFYTPAAEHGIIWNDPTLNIPWPIAEPILSPKDEIYPNFADIPYEHLFA